MENEVTKSVESTKSGNAFDLGDIPKVRRVTGARKAAVLLMTLGTDVSADIVKNLSDKKIQRIGVEIANIHTVNARERREILQEFIELNKGKEFVLKGGIDYAKSLLNGALGNQRANKLIEGIRYDAYTKLFMAARKAEPEQILACIQGESTQTIAIILSHIQSDKAALILSELPPKIKNEVSLKIGSTSSVSPSVIKAIDEAVEMKLSKLGQREMESSGGVDSLVEILGNVDRKTEKSIISYIEERNNELAEDIKANMFIFDDIVRLENSTIQRILKEVNVKDIAFALKGASKEVSNVIFRNQSQRASQALKEEIDLLGKIKISQVEEAQQNIVNVIRRLEDMGEITLTRGSDDEFIM
ncbi:MULTISPECIES: flagellar motor switch protein FliG [Romboutsia]|uniref:Flagellar motor switch protein FliG n=1 Tax=Romboutsia hominis TaxID=1507512 RepID=A0A2P2BPI4_9FIRM|nr:MULTISPECIES: flagellar motor switch protein FliG [Romboutsia]MCH1959581.1 flagellar motor switch protein FliG [Romboutsia hominis]MCH1969996.1 flagellar motor switch protein FliG [Romboutsia hominis]MDB8803905.1 flagellar motor switch protein FliG [Romboutsia sp. 1001216sp1]MDB8806745.1 flagellar motor switch protein FliG [Romboutsia sp. 1001216sp1]MDB8809552.1 flagellar motor switch protein FliG [Romboutsia sp. 1001216sp1]